jgi:hypothetical protein
VNFSWKKRIRYPDENPSVVPSERKSAHTRNILWATARALSGDFEKKTLFESHVRNLKKKKNNAPARPSTRITDQNNVLLVTRGV